MSKAIEFFDRFFLLILIDLDDFGSKLTLILGVKITSKSFKSRFGCRRSFQEAPGGSMRLPRGSKSVSERLPKVSPRRPSTASENSYNYENTPCIDPMENRSKDASPPWKSLRLHKYRPSPVWQMIIQNQKASYHYRSNSLWQLITQKRNSLWQLINQRRKSPCQAI